MDTFQKQIQLELLKQERLLEEQRQVLSSSPEGFLFLRHRSKKDTYYHQRKTRDGRILKTVQRNIDDDLEMQHLLLDKKLAEKQIKIFENNLPLLRKMTSSYVSTDFEDLIQQLPMKYDGLLKAHQAQELEAWFRAPYNRCPYYPERLTHRTAYGDYVRSKGEVVIANALYAFGLPFHTEEELLFADYSAKPYYPDFTILLPDHTFIYWEHWGLLNREKYRRDNVEKLAAYQENDLVLGHNLIITQDDKYGNCHSHVVYDIIEKMILPHFEGIKLPRRSI